MPYRNRTPPALTPRRLLTPGEVAALFRVDPKTATRWAKEGRLTWIRTLGGHRRYHADEVQALLENPDLASRRTPADPTLVRPGPVTAVAPAVAPAGERR